MFLQNQIAAERCAQFRLTRLIWIPDGTAPRENDTLQRDFIRRLHTDPEAQKNAEVLTNSLQGLIARIHDALRKLYAPAPAAPPAAGTRRAAIYLIAHPDDTAMADPLRDHLFDSGFDVLDPLTDPNASETELFESHRMNLVDCDAVIICYGQAGEHWTRTKLSDAQKAIGWRNGRPMAARAIYLGTPDTQSKARLRLHDYLVLDGRAGFDSSQLAPLQALLSQTAGRD